MKKTTYTIFETLKKNKLTDHERTTLVSKIKAYRDFKPLRESVSVKPHGNYGLFSALRPAPLMASFLIISFVGVGTAAAAENTAPGDFLYPVKTRITENVRVALATNVEARADIEAWRAERRLDEAATLVARATLSDERKEKLEERFAQHAQQVESRITLLAETDAVLAAELSVRFEASLAAHDAILATVNARETETTRTLVRKNIDRIAHIRVLATGQIGSTVGAEHSALQADVMRNTATKSAPATAEVQLMATDESFAPSATSVEARDYSIAAQRMSVASNKIFATTQELYARTSAKLTVAQRTRVETQLEKALQTLSEGEVAYTEGLFEEAYFKFQAVLSSMNTLSVLLKNNAYGDIEYRDIHLEEAASIDDPLMFDSKSNPPGYVDPPRLDIDIDQKDASEERPHIKVRF